MSDLRTISLYIVGDSHCLSYPRGVREIAVTGFGEALMYRVHVSSAYCGVGTLVLDFMVTYPDGRSEVNPLIFDAVRRWPAVPGGPDQPPARQLVLCFGGGIYQFDPAMYFRRRFDFILPGREDLGFDEECVILPVEMVREYYRGALAPLRAGLEAFRELGHKSPILLGAPPPHRTTDKTIEAYQAHLGEQPRLSSPATFLKCFLLLGECLAVFCRDLGITFVDGGSSGADSDGFLLPEFEHDGVHANGGFSARMLDRVIRRVVEDDARSSARGGVGPSTA